MSAEYPLFVNGEILENDQDATVYLAKRFGIHHLKMTKMFRDGDVFEGNSPYQMAYNFELASILLKKNVEKSKALSNVGKKAHVPRLIEASVVIAGKTHTFSTKKQVLEFLGKRYATKHNNMYRRVNELCIFWTTDILEIVKDITRADAYTGAYMDQVAVWNKEHYVARKKRMMKALQENKDMPALDGGFYMESSIRNTPKQEEVVSSTEPALVEELIPYYPADNRENRKYLGIMSETLSITRETIRRKYRLGVFTKTPAYYAKHLDVLKQEYQDYKGNVDSNRKAHIEKVHEKHRRGEVSFHPQKEKAIYRKPSPKKKDSLEANIVTIEKKIHSMESDILKNTLTIEQLETKNASLKGDILQYADQLRVLKEARRVIQSIN